MDEIDFGNAFTALTGNSPFPWQRALYADWFSQGKVPQSCNLPTGLGKTSVIAVWLIALANGHAVPRRLVYVVNRRTVVDQTTDEVENYAQLLAHGRAPLVLPLIELSKTLRGMCADSKSNPLAISTLRGQFADNREWSADPSRPAVICGTVDMIGSRLLFSGYGCGFKTRPLHAGFLGQDSLLVHDEAHLEPAFQKLLLAIEDEQKRCNDFRPMKVMELTATSRAGDATPFTLNDDDYKNDTVQKRVGAKKKLVLQDNKDEKKLAEEIAGIAAKYKDAAPGPAVLVFVRKVDDVDKVTKKLPKDTFEQLTGTLRGLERDQLVKKPIFQRFLPKSNRDKDVKLPEGTVYLVCTSAGEVGVNISADHLVCDLSTFESMAQRFGRVNRFGDCDDTEIHVVHPMEFEDKDEQVRLKRTLGLLELLRGKASPTALTDLKAKAIKEGSSKEPTSSDCVQALRDYINANQGEDPRLGGYAPQPKSLPTSDILFDAWALTTIEKPLPGRPEVDPYLHGIADEQRQATIAWRAELDLLCDEEKPEPSLNAFFAKHSIRPHESLTVPSYRVESFLKEMVKAKPELNQTRVALHFGRGVKCATIEELVANPGPLFGEPTLVLPVSFGGLDDKGMLNAKYQPEQLSALDIADKEGYEPDPEAKPRLRVLIDRTENDDWKARLLPDATSHVEAEIFDGLRGTSSEVIKAIQQRTGLKVRLVRTLKTDAEGDSVQALVCLSALPKRGTPQEQLLVEHVNGVVTEARKLAKALLKDDPVAQVALVFAAEWHDEGKKAKRWQRYIRGKPGAEPLGKSAEWRDPKILSRYRHEFGSLLRIPKEDADKLGEAHDLALHLIAAHHGFGRPHFTDPWDDEHSPDVCNKAHERVIQRYALLQRKYGRWGLAYLESLLRAADAAASRAIGIDTETDNDLEEEGEQ